MLPSMAKRLEFVPIDLITFVCPFCGAKPGDRLRFVEGKIDLVHVERIKVASVQQGSARSIRKK